LNSNLLKILLNIILGILCLLIPAILLYTYDENYSISSWSGTDSFVSSKRVTAKNPYSKLEFFLRFASPAYCFGLYIFYFFKKRFKLFHLPLIIITCIISFSAAAIAGVISAGLINLLAGTGMAMVFYTLFQKQINSKLIFFGITGGLGALVGLYLVYFYFMDYDSWGPSPDKTNMPKIVMAASLPWQFLVLLYLNIAGKKYL